MKRTKIEHLVIPKIGDRVYVRWTHQKQIIAVVISDPVLIHRECVEDNKKPELCVVVIHAMSDWIQNMEVVPIEDLTIFTNKGGPHQTFPCKSEVCIESIPDA